MPESNHEDYSNNVLGIVIACVLVTVIVVAGIIGYRFWQKQDPKPGVQKVIPKVIVPVKPQPVIDYNKLDEDQNLRELMQKRKAKYGLEKGVDIITKSDETVKIGESTVPMQEILDEIRLKLGDIIEKDLQSGASGSGGPVKEFGIHVVQPGDNIWNLHFKFLKDYFDHKGVALSPWPMNPAK